MSTNETDISKKIVAACEKHWATWQSDCSGFVKAVAKELGVPFGGAPNANAIVDAIQASPWTVLSAGAGEIIGELAARTAGKGLVIAGHKASGNGHVAIVVPGSLAFSKYPHGYWGSIGGFQKKNETLNYSWTAPALDELVYAWRYLI